MVDDDTGGVPSIPVVGLALVLSHMVCAGSGFQEPFCEQIVLMIISDNRSGCCQGFHSKILLQRSKDREGSNLTFLQVKAHSIQ